MRTRVQCPGTLPAHLPAAQPAFLGGWATPFFTGLLLSFFFVCVSERLIFPSSCIDYSATRAPSRGTNGYVASVKTTSTGATPAFLPKYETRNPSTFGPNVLTGGCRRSGSKSKVYAKRTPCVNCANESTVSGNTTRAPSGSTTRALSENSVAIIFLWCSPGGHYFSLLLCWCCAVLCCLA